jgi:penicillin-binding protein 1A
LYATVLEMGIDPCEFVSNEIRVYEDYDDWSPTNANGEHEGYYSMKGALAQSSNTVSAHYIMQTGVDPVISTARRAGITNNLPAVPSLALGTADLSLFELTAAYSIFINEGKYIEPTWLLKIEDANGRVIYEQETKNSDQSAINEHTALMVRDMLEQVVKSGTAHSLVSRFGISSEIAGKTGTTQNNADTWFIGFSPNLITGVWTGIENPAFARIYRTPLGSGASAVSLWGEYAVQASRSGTTRKYFAGNFTQLPDSLALKMDCPQYLDQLPGESWFERLFGTPDDSRERTIRRGEQPPRESRLRRFLREVFQQD